MPKPIVHYEYLAESRIRILYQQIHKGWFRRMPFQVSLSPLQLGQVTLGKPAGNEPPLTEQLDAVVAHLKKHQPIDIGTIDEPKKYIAGTLPMFTHTLPQGFGVQPSDEPEFIYFGGSTDTTILGLAGPVGNVPGQIPAGDSMNNVSSAVPNLVQVLAKQYRIQTRLIKTGHVRGKNHDGLALTCLWYMENYNREGMQLRNYSFLATVRLDSQRIFGTMHGKRIILASPVYVALAD